MSVNYAIKSVDEWNAAISSMEKAKQSMQDAGDKMKEVVLESLTKNGITGDTANAIIKAYEEDVLVVIKRFIEAVDNFIERNRKSSNSADTMLGKLRNTVDRM